MTPTRWDHELIIAETYDPATVTLTQEDGSVYDLTGATGEVQLRTEPGGALVLEPTWAAISAAAGTFRWSATPAETADLVPGTYRYAVRLTFSGGTVRTVLEGRVTVRRGVVS